MEYAEIRHQAWESVYAKNDIVRCNCKPIPKNDSLQMDFYSRVKHQGPISLNKAMIRG